MGQSVEDFLQESMASEIEGKVWKKILWPQWIAGCGVTLLMLHIGMMAGWSSPYVAYLTSPSSHLEVTQSEISWVVSLLNLGRLIGAIFGSVCVNYLGSKTTILTTTVPIALCWAFTVVGDHIAWLYSSRLFGGISLGMTYSSFSLYLGEIADPKIRGALVSLGMTGISTGNLVMCIMGASFPMETSGIISLCLCIVLTILFLWLPESPYHLIRKDIDKAKASLLFYHRDCNVEEELSAMKKFIEEFSNQSFVKTLGEFKKPQIRKAMTVVLLLFLFSQMCGLNNILFYMETILTNAGTTVIQPSIIVIIVMFLGVLASCLSLFLIDRCGRRILMVSSCALVSVSLVGLGTIYQLLELGFDSANFQWLPIFSVILFQVAVFIGILSVPSAVVSEIFPPNVKCVAACFGSIGAGIFSFLSTATYQPLLELFKEQYTFWIYAVLLMIAVPFTLIFLPETKGKTLQEIQKELLKKV